MRPKRPWIPLLAAVLATVFAWRVLLLIDATGLWTDELYSVGKSFQPSPVALIGMLREDTHPPFYYGVLWLWGQLLGQSPLTLRLLSWLAYVAGGLVMTAQAIALAGGRRVAPLALLLAFCSPYPIRFAIEGKSYALLVLLVALAWWWRRAERRVPYALMVAMAALTHFYGLFLFLTAAVWDAWNRRWRMAWAAGLAVLPALAWIAYASAYLFSARSGSWIGRPDFALLEETLARAIGLWPIPKLILLLVLLVALRRWCGISMPNWGDPSLLDRSGLMPSLCMVVPVVTISFIKPLAFSRYFVVLLPALLPWLAVHLAQLDLNRWGRRLVAMALVLMLLSWWVHGFRELDPIDAGVREQDHFRAVSQRAAVPVERYSPRARLLNLSDRMEQAMGRLDASALTPWRDRRALQRRLATLPLPTELWLASSGPDPALERKMAPLLSIVEQAGFHCDDHSVDLSRGQVLQCRSGSRGLDR